MKHITPTSKTRPAVAASCWWQDALDKIACVIDPELDKCEVIQ